MQGHGALDPALGEEGIHDGRGGGALAHALVMTAGTLVAAAVGLWLGSALA